MAPNYSSWLTPRPQKKVLNKKKTLVSRGYAIGRARKEFE